MGNSCPSAIPDHYKRIGGPMRKKTGSVLERTEPVGLYHQSRINHRQWRLKEQRQQVELDELLPARAVRYNRTR